LEIRPGLALRQPPAVEVAPTPVPDPAASHGCGIWQMPMGKKVRGLRRIDDEFLSAVILSGNC